MEALNITDDGSSIDSADTMQETLSRDSWSAIDRNETNSSDTNYGANEKEPKELKFDFDIYESRSEENEVVSLEDFSEKALDLFETLDTNQDGFLGEQELALAMQTEYKGQDAQLVAALYHARESLQVLSDDEYFSENDGITRDDLLAFDEKPGEEEILEEAIEETANWMDEQDAFSSFDSDNNDYLTLTEIEDRLRLQGLSVQERKSLEFLRDNYAVLDNQSEISGVREDDITDFELDAVDKVRYGLNLTHNSQQYNPGRLYENEENPLESITPEAVDQGSITNCYFLASIASLAETQPELIYQMIQDNSDGTYTVTFPGAPDNPLTVEAPTDAECGLYNNANSEGYWVNVLEKAYGMYRQQMSSLGRHNNSNQGSTPSEGGDGGESDLGRAMQFLSGSEIDYLLLDAGSQESIRERLIEALSDGDSPVIASTDNSAPDYLKENHVYSVLDFDPDGDDGGTITMFNPWNGSDGTTHGLFEISLERFMEDFEDLVFCSD